ncbi:MAG: Arc family DNA-binding protein [Armatimonadetes bacterium]|nr:Arc family DNA-binding protein [Armatimonadota bacterium]
MAEKKAFPLRLPQDLHDQVQRLASAELRSVNAQIEILLREALKKRGIDPHSPNQDSGKD